MIWGILLAAGAGGFLLYWFVFRKKNPLKPTFTGAMSDKYVAVTPKGAHVHSGTRIDPAKLAAVDAGLDRLFRIAANPPYNYTGFSTHSNYTIWLVPRSDLCVNPGFTEVVTSAQWPDGYDEVYTDSSNNHWDKDPRAGHCLLCISGFMAVGAGHQDQHALGMAVVDDLGLLPTIVRYEGEHNLLYEVDRPKFEATQFHYGTNGGHPILPDPEGESFAAIPLTEQPHPVKNAEGRNLLVTK